MIDDTVSYWHKTARVKPYPRLEKNIEIDTLIVGGGITGVTCAYCLARQGAGAGTVLIEAGGLCDGTTGSTTAKVTIQHGLIYSRLLREKGRESAKMYASAQAEALEFVRTAVKAEDINCNLADNTAYLYAQDEDEAVSVEREYEAAVMLGISAEFIEKPAFPHGGLCMTAFENQAVFHPVRYVSALAEAAAAHGARIFGGTKAVKVEDGDIVTVTCENSVTIKAKHLVMATQYPIYDGMGFYFTRLYAKRDYGVAVRTKREWPDGSYKNTGEPSRSIRTHVEDGKRVFIAVGEEHFTSRSGVEMSAHHDNLISFANEEAGVGEVLAKWSAQDYETPDGIPYIGRLSSSSHIFIASGFDKWGMTNGTLAGNLIADLIKRGANRYEELFSPARADIKGSAGKFVSEVGAAVGELVKSKFEAPEGIEDMKPGEGRVINFSGNKAGIYLDDDGNVIIVDIACTHMSTHLNFNSAEKTWDCPAHGGRFAFDGKLLEGPPKNPLKVLFKGRYSDLTAEKRR